MIGGRHGRRRLQSQDSDKLQSTPFNTDSFLPYSRPYMKFYKTTTSEFALSAPKCQDSFKFITNKSASITPGSISVPSKQFMAMETVKREQVQILTVSFVSYFLRTLDKCASNIEEMLQGVHSSVSEEVAKEVEEMLSFLQIQFSCLNSLDKALETVIDSSMIMACNLELARRDTTLKVAASHLHEHDRNRLRRSGFMSQDLFSPSIVDAVEKKLEKERCPKRQKVDHKPIFQSKRSYNGGGSSSGSTHTPSSGKNAFRSEFKSQQSRSPLTPLEVEEEVVGSDYMIPNPGGRLLLFYKVWLENGCHPRVVHILQWDYKIILRNPIELSRHPTIHSGDTNRDKQKFLQDCVAQMLKKKAIVLVRMCRTLGFYSRLFLVPKPGKKWRPVIDLSLLNNHLSVPTFKMETAEVIRNAICKGEWVVSIDLTDAYFHIPVHEKSQHLLRFRVAGKSYQFWALPFGIVTAPLKFSQVVKEVKLMLQNGNSGSPVSRRLVTSCPNVSSTFKATSRVCSRT